MKTPDAPILLVDDEDQILQSTSLSLRTSGINHIVKCNDPREVLGLMHKQKFTAIVLDVLMPGITGKDLLPKIVELNPHVPVIMMTALSEVDTAVDCMKSGAFDYLVKPVDKTRLVTTVTRAIEYSSLNNEKNDLKETLLSGKLKHPLAFEGIITRHSKMKSIFQYIDAISSTPYPVLIQGDTGTGKEMMAKAIHLASGRKGEFVAVNVAGLDDNLFSDTLFGHVKGAFTGADKDRKGLIAKAEEGTLFLDEIGDLAMESQVKLLRLLEEKTYLPVGSDVTQPTSARIVVATNIDFEKSFKTGSFRSDLYYRLHNHKIDLPALKERKEDIPLLADNFLESTAQEIGKETPTPPEELYKLLGSYHWPGNIRELKSMISDAVGRHTGGILSMASFKERIQSNNHRGSEAGGEGEAASELFLPDPMPTLKEIEKVILQEALKRAQGNQSIAAQMIGMTRSALNKRLNKPE